MMRSVEDILLQLILKVTPSPIIVLHLVHLLPLIVLHHHDLINHAAASHTVPHCAHHAASRCSIYYHCAAHNMLHYTSL